MSAHQEALESIAERAKRALQDNAEARLQSMGPKPEVARPAAPEAHAHPAAPVGPITGAPRPVVPEPSGPPLRASDLIEQRIHAIHILRELDPKRFCFRQRVEELSRRLVHTPGDSVHYGDLLQWLAEAHAELRRLESQIEEAQHVVRSTEWLVDMLTDPTRRPTTPECESP